jgi:hypothetical protein
MSTTTWIVLLAVGAASVLLIMLVAAKSSKTRREALRRRFGPEYDRAVQEHGSVSKAERALALRARRVHGFQVRALNDADRVLFSNTWSKIQARFVDDPTGAVHEADRLIKTVMQARGYPLRGDFDDRVADLSVDHANVVQHYRAARVLADANREGRANTEELRQAFVHYRALFADLLEEPAPASHHLHEAPLAG